MLHTFVSCGLSLITISAQISGQLSNLPCYYSLRTYIPTTVFNEMKFAMSQVPQTVLSLLQAAVSLRRIETYLQSAEVPSVAPLDGHSHPISLVSATVTWPSGARASAASTPRGGKFILTDLNLNFPLGELSLVCGKLGSGKSLLLLALLGEADVLAGQVLCPRTPPDALAMLGEAFVVPDEEWIVPGVCAYVPQSAWLRNASIKGEYEEWLVLGEETLTAVQYR